MLDSVTRLNSTCSAMPLLLGTLGPKTTHVLFMNNFACVPLGNSAINLVTSTILTTLLRVAGLPTVIIMFQIRELKLLL